MFQIHFFLEPFCVSLKRTLPPMHPLNQILKFHCRELIVPNTFGTPALVNEARFMDLLFAYGNDGAIRLLRDAHPFSTWDITDFRRNIKVQLVKYSFKMRISSSRGVVTFTRLELSTLDRLVRIRALAGNKTCYSHSPPRFINGYWRV